MQTNIVQIIKGILVGVLCSLIFVLIVALFSYLFSWSSIVVKPIVQGAKILAICIGVFAFTKGEGGLIKGILIGSSIWIITYFLFGCMACNFQISYKTALDLFLGLILGAICGIFAVNMKNKS